MLTEVQFNQAHQFKIGGYFDVGIKHVRVAALGETNRSVVVEPVGPAATQEHERHGGLEVISCA